MEEKCFCHLNGYKVKDADARRQLEEHGRQLSENAEAIRKVGEAVSKNEEEIKFSRRVMVEDFGAVGDGVANDTEAFKNAIAYCNENKETLYTRAGIYRIYASDILVECDIDFSGATVLVEGTVGTVFSIGKEVDRVSFDYLKLTKSKVNDPRFYGMGFWLHTPLNIGKRKHVEGDSGYKYYSRYVKVDNDGNIVNGFYKPQIVQGQYSVYNARPLNEKGCTIKNVTVDFKVEEGQASIPYVFYVKKNNCKIEGVRIANKSINSVAYANSIIHTWGCCNCEINNVTGDNVIGQNSGYVVEISASDNVIVRNFTSNNKKGGSWASIGCGNSTNLLFENCDTYRIDMHYLGTYTARNCRLNASTFSGGYGNIVLENCEINGNTTPIFMRNDLAFPLSGKIIVRDCTIDGNNPSVNTGAIINLNFEDIDFDITQFNYEGIDIIVENTAVKDIMALTGIKSESEEISSKINLTFEKVKTNSSLVMTSYSGDYKKINSLKILNSRIKPIGTGCWIGKPYMKQLIVDNSVFESTFEQDVFDPSIDVTVTNNIFNGLRVATENVVKIIGNTCTKDVAPYLSEKTPKSMAIIGNTINADTLSNLSSWNIVPNLHTLEAEINTLKAKVQELETSEQGA